jgi:hypothetical protein
VLLPVKLAVAAPGDDSLDVTIGAIQGFTSRVDLAVVSLVFLASFGATLLLYVIGKGRRHVGPLDTYTSGEDPADWNMTPEQYHYAYNFYEPFEKMTAPVLALLDIERWYAAAYRTASRASRAVAGWLHGPRTGALLFTAALLVILFLGIRG